MEAERSKKKGANVAPVPVFPKAGVIAAVFSQKGSGRCHDLHPLIPSAGVASARDRFTARDAIQCDTHESLTSRSVDSHITTSAAAFGLPGVQRGLLSRMRSAGRATGTQDQSVGSLLSNQFPATSIGRFLLQQQEKIYRGVYSKPLGRSVPHSDVQLPDQDDCFRFGIKQSTDEVDAAKKLIFAPVPEPTQKELALYKQTHHAYLPGEAVDRGYAVKHIDMRTYCFGKKSSSDSCTDAKQCISWSVDGEGSKIVSKAVEDYHMIRHPEVGKCTRSAAGRPPVPPGFSFGLPTAQDEASAEECLKMCTPNERRGKPATTNNTILEHTEKDATTAKSAGVDERAFGIPSVRTDIKPPKRRPIDDHVNYGDEPAMGELLFPSPLMAYDVKDEDFLVQHSKDQIQRVLRRSMRSNGDDAELVYKAVDLAFEKATNDNGSKHAKEKEASRADVNGSRGRPPSASSKRPHDAIGGSRQSSTEDGDEPTISLADVLEAYAALIKKKVALETRSITQAPELYMRQSPLITLS